MPKLEEVYNEKKLAPEDARTIFTDLMANYWGGAMFSQATGNKENVYQAKKNFYKGLDKMLQYEYAKDERIGRENLEKLREFQELDWMDSEVMEKLSERMRELLGRKRQ